MSRRRIVEEDQFADLIRPCARLRDVSLSKLIERAREYVMTDAEREEQIRSFAYGNVVLSNPSITREDIDRAAERMGR